MEAETTLPTTQGRKKRISTINKCLLIATAVVAAIIVAVIVGAILNPNLNPFDYIFLKPTEHSASYYPEDTFLYSYMTIYPRGTQRKHMLDLVERFNELRSFKKSLDEQKETLEDETGISFDQDVTPAIGPDLSFGILGFDDDQNTIMASTLSVRDKDKAEILLEQFLDYLEDEHNSLFDKDNYQGHPIWIDYQDKQAYALTDSLIVAVVSGDDSTYWLEEMLDLIEDDSRKSLADNDQFQEAMKGLPKGRFASAFVNYEDYLDHLEEVNWFADYLPQETMELLLPPWDAYGLQWEERAITATSISPAAGGEQEITLDNPAALLPQDTMAYLAVADDYDMDRWQKALEDIPLEAKSPTANPVPAINRAIRSIPIYGRGGGNAPILNDGAYTDELVASALQVIEDLTGIDPEAELFDHLGDQTIIALEQFSLEDLIDEQNESPINANIIVQHQQDSEDELEDTLRSFSRWLREYYKVDTDVANVGAERPARVLDMSRNRRFLQPYNPGYVVNDGYLVMGTTEEALENVVAVQNGDEPPLASLEEHKRAIQLLPKETGIIAWLDLQSLVAEFDPDDSPLSRDQYRALRRATGTIAIARYTAKGTDTLKAVVTMFPN